MPTYRYECGRCEAVHEMFQSMSDKPETKCPDCGGKLTRLIGTGGGVILKGSGFYTTDYRSDSYHAAAKKDNEASKPAASDGGKKKEGKSDAKPKKSDAKGKKKH
ncbi:zinc ribbon domain-containing protein [bacterium]|nr:zinc ribbon domain-containing protein [bacterium]